MIERIEGYDLRARPTDKRLEAYGRGAYNGRAPMDFHWLIFYKPELLISSMSTLASVWLKLISCYKLIGIWAPSVATPSKPSEPRKRKRLVIEYFDAEASDDLSGCVGENKADPLSDNKRMKTYFDAEASDDLSGCVGENKADPLSDNKRMKRVLIDDSTGDISCGTPEDGNTDRADGRSNKKKGSPSSCAVKFRHNFYSGMTGGSSNDPMVNPSLLTMLHNCVLIASKTIVGQDGRIHSYCGLKLADIPATGSSLKEKGSSSTSRYAHTRASRIP
ncbi:hypothetical protein Tco_0645238 [Tanacetum coccineum]